MRALLPALAALSLALATTLADGQQYFGQNQVPYERFDWKVLETEHFQVHYYPAIADAAVIAAQMAERAYARLSPILGHEFREKKPIILFASRMDFAQNNITGDLGEGTGGVTDFLRQRNMVFFTGELRDFERVLMHEMVHVFQYDIFSRGRAGTNFERLARVAPPYWFMEGMAEYLTTGPHDPATDAIIRDAALNGKLPTVEEMTTRPDLYFPYRYGQSFWAYVGDRWGDFTIGDVMKSAASVGIERAFARETGTSLDDVGLDWREAMQELHLPRIADRERVRTFSAPLLDSRRTGGAAPIYVAPSLSPDGEQIAYISTGSYLRAEVFLDLYLADVKTGRRRQRLTKSTQSTDTEELRILYSQAAFSPDGKYLAYTAQRRGKDVLYLLDIGRNRVVQRYDTPLEQMLGPSFSPDGSRLVFSGSSGGTSDLYIIDVDGGNLQRLTRDVYGDVQPSWSPDGRYVAFASERGPQSDLSVLMFGPRRIAIYDLETAEIRVLPGQAGMNSNPQWSPDGRTIAYVSDRTGTHNIFLYDLDDREHYQITDAFGSVLSFTEQSPALSWAREADRIAFTFYENGEYTVRSIERPRQRKREPYRDRAVLAAASEAATEPAAKGTPEIAADSTAGHAAMSPDSSVVRSATQGVVPQLPERLSLFVRDGVLRRAAELPEDTSGQQQVTVAAMLDSAALALPDPGTFRSHDYRPGLSPEMITRPVVGYTQENFGRGMFGGSSITLSDMLGNHRLGVAAAINGRLSESVLFASYANLSRRLQYVVGAQQLPYFLFSGASFDAPDEGSGNPYWQDRQRITRYVFRDALANSFYPLDRFTRLEAGITLSQIEVTDLHISRDVDVDRGLAGRFGMDSVVKRGSSVLASPYVAYVQDNAIWGMVGPIMGHRLRVQYRFTTGDWKWNELLVDARRYDPILFNFLTLSTRFTTNIRAGSDEERFPQMLGRPEFVRGYDREFYRMPTCASGLPMPDEERDRRCSSLDDVIGTRLAFANAELRFPLVRRMDLGVLPISLPPVEGAVFYDAGVAWNSGQYVALSRSRTDDPNRRALLTSYGFGIRANLFGIAIMRWDYAVPLSRANRHGYWRWSMGPAF